MAGGRGAFFRWIGLEPRPLPEKWEDGRDRCSAVRWSGSDSRWGVDRPATSPGTLARGDRMEASGGELTINRTRGT